MEGQVFYEVQAQLLSKQKHSIYSFTYEKNTTVMLKYFKRTVVQRRFADLAGRHFPFL